MSDQAGEDYEAGEALSEEADSPKKSRKKKHAPDPEDIQIGEDREEGAAQEIQISGDINLEKIVSQSTWRDILVELVASEKLDPWSIDVVEISSEYIKRVKDMKQMDLHIPANLILAAAIMLRFKSDALQLEEEEQVLAPEVFVDESLPPVEIPMLELRTRIPPKRKVTLEELVLAMEKVFDEQKQREEKAQQVEIPAMLNIKVQEFDIDDKIDDIFSRAKKLADNEGLVLFSALLHDKTKEEIVFTLIPLLFLMQRGKVRLFQEKMFGEIFVQMLPAKGG